MTEQEFTRQMWRMYDQITTADGVRGKVLGLNFGTKSVRAFIGGSPEWVRCELIETHTTGKGGNADDDAIIEELHNRVLDQTDEIQRLREEKQKLEDKIRHNYLVELLKAVNMMREGLQEKKNKIEKVNNGLNLISEVMDKIDKDKE